MATLIMLTLIMLEQALFPSQLVQAPTVLSASREMCNLSLEKHPHAWLFMIHLANKYRIKSRMNGSSPSCYPTSSFVLVNIATHEPD